MAVRAAHGNAARGGHLAVVEVPPADELRAAAGSDTGRQDRDALGRFVPGNGAARARRLRPGMRGLVGADRCAEDYRPFMRWGARYAAHRRRELAELHGGTISAGVGAIIESAALAMAASRYLQHRGAQAADVQLLQEATRLASTARQHELAAWELAAREQPARERMRALREWEADDHDDHDEPDEPAEPADEDEPEEEADNA